jgi:hypothetical protein
MADDFWTSLAAGTAPASPFGNDTSYMPIARQAARATEGDITPGGGLEGYAKRMPDGRIGIYDTSGNFVKYQSSTAGAMGENLGQFAKGVAPMALAAIGANLLGGAGGAAEAAGGAAGGAGIYPSIAEVGGAGTGAYGASQLAAGAAGAGAVGNSLASAVAPAVAGMTVAQMVMAGIPLASAVIMANATEKAAEKQSDAVTQANNLQERMYNEQVARLSPYAAGGLTAQNQLMSVLGLGPNTGQPGYGKYSKDFSMADFQADPGYAFRMSEGLKALDRTAASRGGLMSGATLKGTQRYGQDLASQEYSNAFNRYQTNRTNQLQPLGNLMAAGQSAAGGQNTASGSYGTAGSELAQAQGNIAAQQGINTANAYTGALQSGISSYQNQNLMNQLLAYNSKP